VVVVVAAVAAVVVVVVAIMVAVVASDLKNEAILGIVYEQLLEIVTLQKEQFAEVDANDRHSSLGAQNHSQLTCIQAVRRYIPVQNSRSGGIFQYKIFSQGGYSSTKYSARRNIPVQNIQSVGIFQFKIFSQYGYSSKCSFSRDIHSGTKYIQSVRIFQ
jgi:hypothetical protein